MAKWWSFKAAPVQVHLERIEFKRGETVLLATRAPLGEKSRAAVQERLTALHDETGASFVIFDGAKWLVTGSSEAIAGARPQPQQPL